MTSNINQETGSNIKEQINQIIYLIKHKDDYVNAAKIMINNNLSIDTLKRKTLKLSQLEFAKLTDSIIESKK